MLTLVQTKETHKVIFFVSNRVGWGSHIMVFDHVVVVVVEIDVV